MSSNSSINQKTIKKLYARSGNICAMYGCDKAFFSFVNDSNSSVIAHIEGEKRLSARHNPNLSTKEVHDYDNLILLCPNHHTEIDAKENEDEYTVKYLKRMKKDHEDIVSYNDILKPPKNWDLPPQLVVGIMDKCSNTYSRDLNRYDVSHILNFILREDIMTRFVLYSIIINSQVQMYEINMLQVLNQSKVAEEDQAKQLMILEKNGFLEEHHFTGNGVERFNLNKYGEFEDLSDMYGLKLYSGKWCYTFRGKIIYAWYEMLRRDKIKFFNSLVKRNIYK